MNTDISQMSILPEETYYMRTGLQIPPCTPRCPLFPPGLIPDRYRYPTAGLPGASENVVSRYLFPSLIPPPDTSRFYLPGIPSGGI